MPILYIETSTWCGFFLSWPCVPTPNVHSDIWDRVESYAIHTFLARRQKITFTSNLKLIISFLNHTYHSLLQLLVLVASTWQAILTTLVSLRLAWRPRTVSFKIVNHGGHRGDTACALARWRHLVASHEAKDALHRVMRIAPYPPSGMVIKTVVASATIFVIVDFMFAHNHS